MNRIKILNVVGSSNYGGGVQVILPVAVAASREGWRVDILATDPRFQEEIRQAGVGVVNLDIVHRPINPLRDVADLIRLSRFIRSEGYTLVHTHTSKGGIIGRLAAWLAGVPAICHTVHGYSFGDYSPRWQRWIYSAIERIAAGWCDRVISVNHCDRQYAIEHRLCDEQKIVTIPNGISIDRIRTTNSRAETRHLLGLGDGDYAVLCLGRMVAEKGFADVIRAVSTLRGGMRRPFRIFMAGDGAERAPMEHLAGELGVTEFVRFLGFRRDVGDLLNASDLVVLPGLREGLSISLLEAMGAGRPIVTTRIGPNTEVVAIAGAAVLVDPRNPVALAEAIIRVSEDPALAARVSRNASEELRRNYTQDRMVASYLDLYRSLMRGKHRQEALPPEVPVRR